MLKHVREAIRLSGIPMSEIAYSTSKGHIHLRVNGRLVVCASSPSNRDTSARVTAKQLIRVTR